ncbi:quercetin 2,3-dioxygenase [Pollutibacter soli]|uniref:quercetin 2,3-dioxygenase n=1 Tax=Pollutibacter soli TaxID=3034157 RepID=UPI003013AAFD
MEQKSFLSNAIPENSRAIPGALFHFLATGEQTANQFSLIYIEVHKGNEPPAHTHKNEDESYYILEGEIKFWIGDTEYLAKAGDFIHLPKNIPHKFELQSECVKELMWIAPADLGKWFWDNSVPSPDMKPLPLMKEPPSPELVSHFVKSLSEYGVEMV